MSYVAHYNLATPTNSAAARAAPTGQLHPNPAQGVATLVLPPAQARMTATADLRDVQGRVVRSYMLPAGQGTHQLSLEGVAVGVYSLQVITNQGVNVQLLVVE